MGRILDLEARKRKLRETREKSIGNEALLNQAMENLKRNGIKVYLAKTKEAAVSFIVDEIKDEKLIIKSKSNVTREIDLVKALESIGIQVIETDIGDRII